MTFDEMQRLRTTKYTKQTRVSVWDVATRKELGHKAESVTIESPFMPTYTLTRNGLFVLKVEAIVAGEAGKQTLTGRRFSVMDAVTGSMGKPVEVPGEYLAPVTADPLSPDGKTLALLDASPRPNGVWRTEVKLIDAAAGKERFTLGPTRRPIKAFTFSPDGRFVAAATGPSSPVRDETLAAPSEVVIWDAHSGKELARLTDKESIRDHTALRFSPDGSYLISQSSSGASTRPRASSGEGEMLTFWGSPPQPEPKKPPAAKVQPPAPADVPERFRALFASLAGNGVEDAKRVESLFLAALGRLPSDVEARTLAAQLAKRSDKADALKDLLGTLVETAEFKAHAEALGRLAK